MLATLLLELGLPDAPHRDCKRFRSVVPGFIAEVFARHGIDFEQVRPMGSLRRLAFLVEGIPPLTNALSTWATGPMERVGQAADGTLTPVTVQFLQRYNKPAAELEVREIEGVRRLGVHIERRPVLAATVLPAALTELLDAIESSERSRVGKGVDFAEALQWIVALLGDARVRFKWRDIESDRYTYTGSGNGKRVLVPHFYEYHAVLAQAGIRIDEATRREHLHLELNSVAADFGGRCVLLGDQLDQLSMCLDEPAVHLHRGMPPEVGGRFVHAAAFASTYCVGVRRDDGGLAPGWLVVSEKSNVGEEDGHSETELAHRAFAQVVDNAASWLRTKVDGKAKRHELRLAATFTEFVARSLVPTADVNLVSEAVWYCIEAEATLAFSTFSGTHLLLAAQRAVSKRAAARVIELLDELVDLFGVQTEEASEGPPSDEARLAFVVLVFHDLVRAFGANQAPVAERDPLALRKRSEQLFELLKQQSWELPMVGAVRLAVELWGEPPTAEPTATALLGFLRHRATRYAERVRQEPPQETSVSPTLRDEWSLLELLRSKASQSRRRATKERG